MLPLADLKAGQSLVGMEPNVVATIVAVVSIAANAVRVIYTTPDGTLKERLLTPADETGIGPATTERPWAFDGDAVAFQLTCEAKRIDLAFLFDPMMAVHTSNVEPLPHQITAVYESMLSRQPLRFILADDPGAGKTIMAGLYIRELVMRADARRIVIIAMRAVTRFEEAKGHRVVDVSADQCGWDLSSYPPAVHGAQPDARHIEVKGRVRGAATVTVTRNEIIHAVNQGDKFKPAIVFVNPDDTIEGPHYITFQTLSRASRIAKSPRQITT